MHALFALGRYREGAREGQALADMLEGPRATERFGLSGLPYSGACAMASECLDQLGDHAGALELIERGRRVADAAGHLYSQMVIAVAHGETLLATGEAADAIAVFEAAARTCRERRFVGQLINALKNLGLAYLVAGRPADAIPVTQESVDLQDKAKVAVTQPMMHTTLGLAHLQLGDFERAETSLRRALELAARQDARGLEGWAHLAWAELAHRRGDRAGASSAVDAAQEIAEQLGMRPLLERCRAFLRRD
jgi:tetratricopeptide (TPR) repeat protein